ncbi:MAG TPA: protein phosphatase 2C domain-containing protein [bacterium]|nr:protein phosphatase 2C domain-containing protein [bacterium]
MINADHNNKTTVKKLVYAARTDIGKVRRVNEDSVSLERWPDGETLLAVVADGMGGHAKGEVASGIIIETFSGMPLVQFPDNQAEMYDSLLSAFYKADEKIREKASSSPEYYGMGSTVVAAILTPEQCLHLHTGDCRLYHFRNGSPVYVTKDHTIIQILLDSGKISPEEIDEHPMRSVVTSSLGSGDTGFKAEPSLIGEPSECTAFIELIIGDTILLTSDGLHGSLDAIFLNSLVEQYGANPGELVEKAVNAALEAGGEDNISIIAVHVVDDSDNGHEEVLDYDKNGFEDESSASLEESLNMDMEIPD